MDRNWKVYVHISPNGKRYYGITSQRPNERWGNGKRYKHNKYLTRAIDKYGWDNFEHIVLFDNLTEKEAKLLEQMYIALYDTKNLEYGYNETDGGDGTLGWKPNNTWRKKQSDINKGQGNPNYGKHLSDEIKKKISEKNTNPSNETRQKMSENHADFKGKKHPKSKLYIMINSHGEKIGEFCKVEIYKKLEISKFTFNRYIEPFGNIDINRILKNPCKNQYSKEVVEKLKPFNGYKIIKIEKKIV